MTIQVVSGLIVRNGRILLTQRLPFKPSPWLWETPGGKVEEGENPRDALARELAEEVGVTVSAASLVKTFADTPMWLGASDRARNDASRAGDPWPEPSHMVSFYAVPPKYPEDPWRAKEGQGLGWFDADEVAMLGALRRLCHSNRIIADGLVVHVREEARKEREAMEEDERRMRRRLEDGQ